jgi:hypothetical protein
MSMAPSLLPRVRTQLPTGEATRAAFEREAPAATLLHLACHVLADLKAPLDSGLLLAGNQCMTLRDLLGMRLEILLGSLGRLVYPVRRTDHHAKCRTRASPCRLAAGALARDRQIRDHRGAV